jgi:hypothetical protein
MRHTHEPDVKECSELEERVSKKVLKKISPEYKISKFLQIKKTELTLYWIGEKPFVPFFFFCPHSLLCLLLSS